MNPSILADRSRLASFCERRHLVELSVFGSVARGEEGPESDVDVLVSFAAGSKASLSDLVEMREELRGLFGREVDLVEREAIRNPFRREAIMKDREVLYESRAA